MKNEVAFSVYVHANKEVMYDEGERLGLTGEAFALFWHAFREVRLLGAVHTTTGEVRLTGAQYGKELLEAKP